MMYNIDLKNVLIASTFSLGASLAIADGDHALKHNNNNPHPAEQREKIIERYKSPIAYNIGIPIEKSDDTFCRLVTTQFLVLNEK